MEVKKNPLNRISLSICSSLDVQEMIDNFLTACKEDLGCDIVALIECSKSQISFHNISCHPRNESTLNNISEIISLLGDLQDFDCDNRVKGMYYQGITDYNVVFYVFSLPDTGFLVFVSPSLLTDPVTIYLLKDLINRFELSCSMCREISLLRKRVSTCMSEKERLNIAVERLEIAMKVSGTGVIEFIVPGRKLFIGPCVYKLLGFEPYEFPPVIEKWKELVHPEDMNRDFCSKIFLEGSKDIYETSYRVKNKKGQWIWIECKSSVVDRSDSGKPSRIICSVRDITMKKASRQQLQVLFKNLYYSANNDHLTGLFNRQRITAILDEEMDRAARYLTPMSLIIMDIDYFKDVNDRFGHQMGDRVLEQFAEILRSRVRRTDRIGRWGGDEFIIVVIGDVKSASLLAEDLRKTVEESDFNIPFKVTITLGITSCKPTDDMDLLVTRADEALYIAKRKGRNSIITLI